MELCRYLFARFREAGARHVFGIPGDFVRPCSFALEDGRSPEPGSRLAASPMQYRERVKA